jgi:cardiolipin synthase (CMP-forming)
MFFVIESDFYMIQAAIPSLLSILRIILTPIVVVSIFKEEWIYASSLFALASFTDFLDGFLARRFGSSSRFGACIDVIADKILMVSSFGAMYFVYGENLIPAWFLYFLILREAAILFGGVIIFTKFSTTRLVKEYDISPFISGKLATFFQIILICYGMVLKIDSSSSLNILTSFLFETVVTKILFFTALGFSIFSFIAYIVRAILLYESA